MNDALLGKLLPRITITDDCWVWMGWHNNLGYGYVHVNKRDRPAHRMIYEAWHGQVLAKGIDIDHLCRNHGCVNPNHLEAVTHRENLLRGETLFAKQAQQTCCKRGHLLSGDNLAIIAGKRQCRICKSVRDKKWRLKAN